MCYTRCLWKRTKDIYSSLKIAFTSHETLWDFDRKNPTKVVADATPAGLGVVLIQWQKEGPCLTDEKKKTLLSHWVWSSSFS